MDIRNTDLDRESVTDDETLDYYRRLSEAAYLAAVAHLEARQLPNCPFCDGYDTGLNTHYCPGKVIR
jgi:hypothetical protein